MPKIVPTIARVLLGLIYFIFGGMGVLMYFKVMTAPTPPMTPNAEAFFKGIMASGYFFPLLKFTETLCGLMLVINTAPALALVILAPITLNIFLFHACLTPGISNLGLPLAMGLLHLAAAAGYGERYRALFSK